MATALAEQRPDMVAALALIDTGPSPDAYIDQGLLGRLLLVQLPGRLLWGLRTEATIRKAMRTAFTRPVEIPDAFIASAWISELPEAAEPSRPASRAGPAGAGDLRRQGPAVALLVGHRPPRGTRRPRRAEPGLGGDDPGESRSRITRHPAMPRPGAGSRACKRRSSIRGRQPRVICRTAMPPRSAGRRALIWPGPSRRERSHRQGYHGRMALGGRIFIRAKLCRERSHMPRIAPLPLARQGMRWSWP